MHQLNEFLGGIINEITWYLEHYLTPETDCMLLDGLEVYYGESHDTLIHGNASKIWLDTMRIPHVKIEISSGRSMEVATYDYITLESLMAIAEEVRRQCNNEGVFKPIAE